jgi:phosphate transport system substrate-binding protein
MRKAILPILLVIVVAGIVTFFSAKKSRSEKISSSTNATTSNLGTAGAYNCVKGNLTASGSTALAPLEQTVAKKYQGKCADAHITVNLGGSGTGLANAENGSSDIGNSDIFSKKGQEDLVDHQVAVVIFTMIINSKVRVTNLSTEQIKDIYAGNITNWKEVGGSDLPIIVVSRPSSSGTRATFQRYVLGTPETISGPSSLTTDSAGTVMKNVQQTDGAIGYVGSGPAKKAGFSLIKIDDFEPTAENVKSNSYKFWNIEHMYTKGKAKDLAQALIDYMLSKDGKEAAKSLDFVSISDLPEAALKTHQQK